MSTCIATFLSGDIQKQVEKANKKQKVVSWSSLRARLQAEKKNTTKALISNEECVSPTKRVGENKTVLQLKKFADVLLTSSNFFKKKMKILFALS